MEAEEWGSSRVGEAGERNGEEMGERGSGRERTGFC